MGDMFPPRLKKFWDKWNIRGVIMLSLFLQTILIFFAPSRKRTAKKLFLVLIWSAYLLADWAADYAVGQISDSQEEAADKHDKTRELLAFWSPFLLLHLGGPDTITALALEDNELWNRHLFSLVCQAVATVYVILLSTPNRLLTPTVIMLFGGVIKYVERTSALFSASLDKFKDSMLEDPDPGANYAKLMEEYANKRDMNMPTEVIVVEDPEKGLVQYAFKYFTIFKGLIVDLIFTNKQRDESRKFFDSLNPEEALRIIEVELSLIYESLFTKAEILHNWTGAVFRVIALACLVSSLCLFSLKNEAEYEGFDVALTYALLICGIALDSIALLMFCVSDWSIARLRNLKEDLDEKDPWAWVDRVLNWILGFRTLRWKRSICFMDGHDVLDRNFMFRRWSEYVHAYNLIGYCLKIRPKRFHPTKGMIHITLLRHQLGRLISSVLEFFGLTELVEEIRFTTSDRLTRELWEFIFKQVQHKHRFAEDPESAKSISSARGDWTLVETSSKTTEGGPDHAKLLRYVTEKDYDQSILMWHIATELLYQSPEEKEGIIKKEEYTNREFSKILSDYMMYLLIMQPALMSAVHINKTRQDEKENLVKEASRAILSVKTYVEPMDVKGDRSKSVLFDGSVLAQELMKLQKGRENMWEVVSKVWVELLCFAATHCDSQEHASQLSKGGELINFVWLLMAHFGLGDQFQINRDDARAKLIVAK
ncbi:BnaAnng05630D [Brassica napus]|uniref:BnaAnng05630D protein n=1 Tax=Brassica napus TaxID=3708 RepID=A0A078HNI3_BRANA|nr:BnaAnng05630D [Brassica napus]